MRGHREGLVVGLKELTSDSGGTLWFSYWWKINDPLTAALEGQGGLSNQSISFVFLVAPVVMIWENRYCIWVLV